MSELSMRFIVVAILAASWLGACRQQPDDVRGVFGGDRPVTLQLPGDGSSAPRPLLITLHAYGSSSPEVLEYSGLGGEALARGVLHVAPLGLVDAGGNRFWNGGACCDFDGSNVDDAAYIAGLIAEIDEAFSLAGVYVVGFEAGGFLAYDLACRFPELVDGIVSVAGMAPLDASACAGREGLDALHIHGDGDMVIEYDGTSEYRGAVASIGLIAERSGCAPLPVAYDRIDVDAEVEGSETRRARFPGCDASVELWTREASRHLPVLEGGFARRLVDRLFEPLDD